MVKGSENYRQKTKESQIKPFVNDVPSVNDEEEESVTIRDINQDRHEDPLEGPLPETIHRYNTKGFHFDGNEIRFSTLIPLSKIATS